jgi:hypothetical protein
MWVKAEGVGAKANSEDRLLDDFEGLLIRNGEREEILEVLDRVSYRVDPIGWMKRTSVQRSRWSALSMPTGKTSSPACMRRVASWTTLLKRSSMVVGGRALFRGSTEGIEARVTVT